MRATFKMSLKSIQKHTKRIVSSKFIGIFYFYTKWSEFWKLKWKSNRYFERERMESWNYSLSEYSISSSSVLHAGHLNTGSDTTATQAAWNVRPHSLLGHTNILLLGNRFDINFLQNVSMQKSTSSSDDDDSTLFFRPFLALFSSCNCSERFFSDQNFLQCVYTFCRINGLFFCTFWRFLLFVGTSRLFWCTFWLFLLFFWEA